MSFGPSEFVSQMSQPDPEKSSGNEGDGQRIQHNIWLREQGERGNALAFFFPQRVEKIKGAHGRSQVQFQANGYGNSFVKEYVTVLGDIFSNSYVLHWKVGLFWALFLITILSLSNKIRTNVFLRSSIFLFLILIFIFIYENIFIYLNYIEHIFYLTWISIIVVFLFIKNQIQKKEKDVAVDLAIKIGMQPQKKILFDSTWAQIYKLTRNVVCVEKSVFFEVEPGKSVLFEVPSMEGSSGDIEERRRDYARMPYQAALQQGSGVQVEGFFRNLSPGEREYLIPLLYGSRLLGFWAYTVLPSGPLAINTLQQVANATAREVAAFLAQSSNPPVRQYLPWLRPQPLANLTYQQRGGNGLPAIIDSAAQRITLQNALLKGVDVGLIAYDVFGNFLFVNERMQEWFRQWPLAWSELSPPALLAWLGGMETWRAYAKVDQVILEQESQQIYAEKQCQSTIYLHPIFEEDTPSLEKRYTPFSLRGVLFEVHRYSASIKKENV